MTNQEAITLIEAIRPKKCKMVDGRLQGGFPDHDSDTGKAIDAAIEALEKQMRNCEDCRRAYSVPSNPTIYCFEHDCIMRGDNCCRDWSEKD